MIKLTFFLNKFLFWLTTFIFAFIPLYPKFPLINIKGTFVAIRIEDLLITAAIFLWLIYLILSNTWKDFIKDKLTQAIFLFFFIGLVSTFSAIFLTHTVTPHLSFLHFLRRVEFILLLPLVVTIVKKKKELIIILIVLSLTILAVNLYALGQQYLSLPVISTTNSEFSKGLILRLNPGARVNSTFAGHYDLAVFLAMTITILTAVFFALKKRFRLIVIILGGLSLFVLIMTAARQSFLATVIGVALVLIFSNKKKYIFLFVVATVVILLYPSQLRDRFISTITVNVFNLGQRYTGKTQDQQIRSKLNIPTLAVKTSSQSASTSAFASPSGAIATDITPGEPIDTTQLGVYRSFEIRLNIEWPRAIAAFIKNPILGTGYSSIDIATDNDLLRSLGEVGLLGTGALILIFIEVGKRIFRVFNSKNKLMRLFSVGVFSMMIAFLINGLFIDVLEASKVASLFWLMLGLGLATLKLSSSKER